MAHHHSHSRSRADHGHAHSHGAGASSRALGIAALLTGGFMGAEIAGGLISGSLALLADAGHMATDFVSLALAWYGMRLARRPADARRSFGYGRVTVLAAFANGLALFAVAGWICLEAWHRLGDPQPILGGLMLWVAVAGLMVNIAAFIALQSGDRSSLNVRAAALHVAGDLLGSVAAIIAAIVIMATGWTPIDPILSALVALIILRSACAVVKDSAHILLEGTPTQVSADQIREDLSGAIAEIADIHHVHAWSLSETETMVTLHARVTGDAAPEDTSRAIKARLKDRFDIAHVTVEIERRACADAPGAAV